MKSNKNIWLNHRKWYLSVFGYTKHFGQMALTFAKCWRMHARVKPFIAAAIAPDIRATWMNQRSHQTMDVDWQRKCKKKETNQGFLKITRRYLRSFLTPLRFPQDNVSFKWSSKVLQFASSRVCCNNVATTLVQYVNMHKSTYTCMHVGMHICLYVVCMCVCASVCMCVCMAWYVWHDMCGMVCVAWLVWDGMCLGV